MGGGPASEAEPFAALRPIASLVSKASQKQRAASGNSATNASAIAQWKLLPEPAVVTSNHASQSSAVPATAANIGTKGDRRTIATNSATSAAASNRSSPAHATSQWFARCSDGRVALR